MKDQQAIKSIAVITVINRFATDIDIDYWQDYMMSLLFSIGDAITVLSLFFVPECSQWILYNDTNGCVIDFLLLSAT